MTRRIVRVDRVVVRGALPPRLTTDGLRAIVVREITQRLDGARDAELGNTATVSRMIADGVACAVGESRHG